MFKNAGLPVTETRVDLLLDFKKRPEVIFLASATPRALSTHHRLTHLSIFFSPEDVERNQMCCDIADMIA
jgi:hypothetical protein